MSDKTPAHLRNILTLPAQESESEDATDLPSEGEVEYRAFSLPANKPLFAIHFVVTTGDVRSFQYLHLDSNSSFTPKLITLRFMGMQPMQVTIEGRNLRLLYEYVHQHRTRWVKEAARDFTRDGDPIVTKITIADCRELD